LGGKSGRGDGRSTLRSGRHGRLVLPHLLDARDLEVEIVGCRNGGGTWVRPTDRLVFDVVRLHVGGFESEVKLQIRVFRLDLDTMA